MAQLNIRGRVIETTIAYVGALPGGGAANLAHVQREVGRGRAGNLEETAVGGRRVLSLDWKPREGGTLNDCELTVKLLALDDEIESDATRAMLVDADGLVLVLESEEGKVGQNDGAVARVRAALSASQARTPERRIPVVVQMNQESRSDTSVRMDAFGTELWPCFHACPATGDGVMETLAQAVSVVAESIVTPPARDTSKPAMKPGPNIEGNPLLAAFRRIVFTVVNESLESFEERLHVLLTLTSTSQIDTNRASDAALANEVRTLATRLDELASELQRLEVNVGQRLDDVRAEVMTLGDRHKERADALRMDFAALVKELQHRKRWFE